MDGKVQGVGNWAGARAGASGLPYRATAMVVLARARYARLFAQRHCRFSLAIRLVQPELIPEEICFEVSIHGLLRFTFGALWLSFFWLLLPGI